MAKPNMTLRLKAKVILNHFFPGKREGSLDYEAIREKAELSGKSNNEKWGTYYNRMKTLAAESVATELTEEWAKVFADLTGVSYDEFMKPDTWTPAKNGAG